MTITITKRKLALAILALALIAPSTALATHVFDDVDDGKFFAKPVEWAADNKITTGKTPDTFDPFGNVTRGESVTFLKRYDDNIVQPGLAGVQADADAAQADADAAQADADANKSDIAANKSDIAANKSDIATNKSDIATNAADIAGLGEDKISHGEIVMSHGTNDLAQHAFSPSVVLHFVSGTVISGDGAMVMGIEGPYMLDGTTYGLKAIEYCISGVGGGAYIDLVEIYAGGEIAGTLPPNASDEMNRTTSGCYSLDVNSSESMFGIVFVAAGGGDLRIAGVTSTWAPASTLTPLASSSTTGSGIDG